MRHDRGTGEGAAPETGAWGPEDTDDAPFARRLRELAVHYREPPPPPVDAMWAAIEAAHFGPTEVAAPMAAGPADVAASRPPVLAFDARPEARARPGLGGRRHVGRWGGPALGLAAGLLMGVGMGVGAGAALWRQGAAERATAPAVAALPAGAPAASLDPAYEVVATAYFDQAVALLAALPARLDDERPDARLAAQARDLLSTTRLLLDSPAAGADPALAALLDDLELVLAQVVRFPPEHDSTQAALIHEALEAREVLPRLRTAAALAAAPPVVRSGD